MKTPNRRKDDTVLNEIYEGVKVIHRVMGITDEESESELRQDFVFLRGMRERRIKDVGTIRTAGIGIIVTGFCYALWDWVQFVFHRGT